MLLHPFHILNLNMHEKMKMCWHQTVSNSIEEWFKVRSIFLQKEMVVLPGLEHDFRVVGAIVEVIVLIRDEIHIPHLMAGHSDGLRRQCFTKESESVFSVIRRISNGAFVGDAGLRLED